MSKMESELQVCGDAQDGVNMECLLSKCDDVPDGIRALQVCGDVQDGVLALGVW